MSFQVWRRIDGGGNEEKGSIDSEGILFSHSSPGSCAALPYFVHTMLLVAGRQDIEPEWGEALGHLCTQAN
jgi:hypothetical protein